MPSPAYATPPQPHDATAVEKPPRRRASPGTRASRGPRGIPLDHPDRWPLALIAALVAHAFDGYLRRTLEAKINQKLHGYHVALGHAHLSPFGLGLTLRDVVIRQDANPEPPVADDPAPEDERRMARVLTGHLVADAVFYQPRVHVNLPQLEVEAKDTTKMKDRGWQQAFESIYPLKFNLMQVRDGDLVYIDADPKRPLHVSHWNVTASNIRNIQSHDRDLPLARSTPRGGLRHRAAPCSTATPTSSPCPIPASTRSTRRRTSRSTACGRSASGRT